MDKILVVDDEPDTANLARMILEAAGYHVLCASDGEEALKMVENVIPDLILLDLVMPGKSGLEVCKVLKNQRGTKATPVVMFTALDRPIDRRLTSDAGADAHLTKPFTKDGLLTEIAKSLKEAQTRKFSKQLGIDHSNLLGRKILLEFDPRTDYDRIIRDFVLECRCHGEAVFIITQRASAIRHALQDEENIKLIDLDPEMKLSPLLDENRGQPFSLVLDSLTSLARSKGSEEDAYRFAENSLHIIGDSQVIAIFLLNPMAHDTRGLASLRGLFSNQLVYENRGMKFVRFS
jgi:CheY-like chemotaxis protein